MPHAQDMLIRRQLARLLLGSQITQFSAGKQTLFSLSSLGCIVIEVPFSPGHHRLLHCKVAFDVALVSNLIGMRVAVIAGHVPFDVPHLHSGCQIDPSRSYARAAMLECHC